MKKKGAEIIIIVMLIPILLTISGYGLSKTVNNSEAISRLKEADKYQVKAIDEMHKDIKLLLKRVN